MSIYELLEFIISNTIFSDSSKRNAIKYLNKFTDELDKEDYEKLYSLIQKQQY